MPRDYIITTSGIIYRIVPRCIKVGHYGGNSWEEVLTLEEASQEEAKEVKEEMGK